MKIVVLGAAGMAGHMVSHFLRENGHDVTTISGHNKLDDQTLLVDATDKNLLTETLDGLEFDVIVNCIGVLVKQSSERKDLAAYLNAYLPHFLEEKYKDTNVKIIHLSTDCVFSGKNAPYQEDSFQDGELFYDRSKALGEIINDKDLTFRMSIIGPDMLENGSGLFNWFYAQTGQVSGYTKAIWSGVTTLELAKGIQAALEQNLTGLYHLVPSTNISKFDLINLFKKEFGRDDITITPNDSVALDKTLINTRTDFDHAVPNYEEMIKEMHEWVVQHPDLYPHYQLKRES